MSNDIYNAVESAGLVKTIICILVCLIPLVIIIIYMLFGPRIKHPVPLAPVPGPKNRKPDERHRSRKT